MKAAVRNAMAIAAVMTGPAGVFAEGVAKIETLGAWSLYADSASPHAFCFVTSEPTAKAPEGATREAPRMYISTWPKDGVKAEVSIRAGFPVKANEPATARVGDVTFNLFSSETRLYVKDETAELKLIEAMKKGADLTAEITSERGTKITDTYSLTGLGQALGKLQQTCR